MEKVEEAQAAIEEVVSYAGQAGDAVSRSGRRVKNTEIALRKMAHRLTDIKHTLASENQAPVQAAVDSLEKIRTDLLNRMFGKKPNEPSTKHSRHLFPALCGRSQRSPAADRPSHPSRNRSAARHCG